MDWRWAPRTIRERIVRDDGQDLIEYGLLAAFIVVTAIVGVKTLGDTVNTVLWEVIANYH